MNSQWKEDGMSASVTKYTIVEDPPHDSEALTYLVVQSQLNCFCTDNGFRVQVGADKVTKQLIGDPQTRNYIVKSCPYADYA